MTTEQFTRSTKALNQLASLIAGRHAALATNDLAHDPIARLEMLSSLITTDLQEAAKWGDQSMLKGATRKLESLGSLRVLAAALLGTDVS